MRYPIATVLRELATLGRKVAIIGPTCSGKSAVALTLAKRGQAEILSCDSMQVFRGMDIGTAKATPQERAAVPHHLIDILEIDDVYNVRRFTEFAECAARDCARRGVPVLLVGGSGLFAKSLAYGLSLNPADPRIAAQVWRECQSSLGFSKLSSELRSSGLPEPALTELCRNPRRLARAVEVLRITGHPPVHADDIGKRDEDGGPFSRRGWLQIVMLPPIQLLRDAIRARVAKMLGDGWVSETEQLLKKNLLGTPTARQALGYRTIAAFLRGEPGCAGTFAGLEERLVAETVRYARRQRTWFRRQHPGSFFVEAISGDSNCDSQAVENVIQTVAAEESWRHPPFAFT